ncbi:MAG: gfo/Idh/MocA family oxidoreductase [Rhodobacteraceae bacterium]|nr:MAG: gfo/Idh/MocA family oxidoreductase [Paracoccaceae bacterium]
MRPVRTAVIGAGVFGARHVEKYAALPEATLVAVVDRDADRAAEIAARFGVMALTDHRDLPTDVEAVSVATPTAAHHAVGMDLIARGVHLLIEKPMARTVAEAAALADAAEAAGVVLQVGHIERHSSVFGALRRMVDRPLFIQSDRIAAFTGRSTDVNVVLDLMIHDIDLVIALVGAPIASIEAVGAPVLTATEDIANARIGFENGCVATITASRISYKTERKLRVFQRDSYIVADLAARRINRVSRSGGEGTAPELSAAAEDLPQTDSLMAEIAAFLSAVRTGAPPPVTGRDGVAALRTALAIGESLSRHRALVSRMLAEEAR